MIKNVKTENESFLNGHSKDVSCLTISHDGRTLASGQTSIVGMKVRIFRVQ